MFVYYLFQNVGDIVRKYIKDVNLLFFIDVECFIVSIVDVCWIFMINVSMVMCDRYYGGINYFVGGVGWIVQEFVDGFVEYGGELQYKVNVI